MDKITYLKLIHFMKYQTIAPPRSWWRRIVNSGHFLHATFAGTRLTWIPWGESPVCSCTAARWPRRRPQTGSWTSRIWKEGSDFRTNRSVSGLSANKSGRRRRHNRPTVCFICAHATQFSDHKFLLPTYPYDNLTCLAQKHLKTTEKPLIRGSALWCWKFETRGQWPYRPASAIKTATVGMEDEWINTPKNQVTCGNMAIDLLFGSSRTLIDWLSSKY